jgi:predicted ribosome quality control (RQC) complex YloA/Tae2 family protein
MSKIPEEVIQEWAKKKKHIQNRLNRIKKRLKKFQKQEKHFELRLRLVQQYEKENKSRDSNRLSEQGVSGQSVHQDGGEGSKGTS